MFISHDIHEKVNFITRISHLFRTRTQTLGMLTRMLRNAKLALRARTQVRERKANVNYLSQGQRERCCEGLFRFQ